MVVKGEVVWLTQYKSGEVAYVVTSNAFRTLYYLYKMERGNLVKTKHKSQNPISLYSYME